MAQSIADILNAAADLLSKPGVWIRGEYATDEDGDTEDTCWTEFEPVCFCAIGAINRAAGKPTDYCDSYPAMDFFGRFVGDQSIYLWNDDPGRTQDEVVSALREAAALALVEPIAHGETTG